MRLATVVLALSLCAAEIGQLAGAMRQKCKPISTDNLCTKDCQEAYVDKQKQIPGGCIINVGACRQIRCRTSGSCNRNSFCRPKMEERKFQCGERVFVEKVVAACTGQPVSRIEVRGRVVERVNDGASSAVSGVGCASVSVPGFYRRVRVNENGFFRFYVPYCIRKVVIRAAAEGFVSNVKVVDIPSDNLGVIENVQVVLFQLADPVLVEAGEENVLETTSAARVVISAGTIFRDEDGNEAGGNINAILNFIDPSNANFDDSPGRFVTDSGGELISFGVLNLRFQADDGSALIPDGDIRIVLVDTDATDYKLWLLNSDGEWTEKSSSSVIGSGSISPAFPTRGKRQAGGDDLGGFGDDDIGQWINIDKVTNGEQCYVKTRVFEDATFTSEVVNNGVDKYQPKFLLKVGNSAPYQGLNLYRPPTFNPGQTCHEVRCGDDPRVKGYISVYTQETLGNGQSVPFPAIPVQQGNPTLPPPLNTELVNHNYAVNMAETEASLDFRSSPTGPLYQDQTVCENSSPTDNSLWFARRKPVFTGADLGTDFCYARIMSIYHRGDDLVDQLQGTSVWGTDPYYYADSIVQKNEFVPSVYQDFACLRYRCSEDGDLTTVYLDTFVTKPGNITCTERKLTPPVLDPASPVYGYYYGVDEVITREECLAVDDPEKWAGSVYCYITPGPVSDVDSTG